MKSVLSKRILYLIHYPPPRHGSSVMGQYLKESKVIASGIESRFINLSLSRELDMIGRVDRGKILRMIRLIFMVLKELIIFKPHLFFITPTSMGPGFYKDFVFIMLGKLVGVKEVFLLHNKGISGMQNRTIDNILYRISFRNACCILLTPLLRNDVQKYLPSDRTFFCPNGIPLVDEAAVPAERKTRITRILFLSNMSESKGVLDLLEACRLLKGRVLNFECHFVGSWTGITMEDFLSLSDEYGLSDHVFGHGARYGKEKEYFFRSSDLFVLPSRNDVFPLVLLEAMQYGLPVISTFEGGIPDIVIDNETGFLVNPGDSGQLADRIELIIRDRALGERLGVAGRIRFSQNYTIGHWEEKMHGILTKILEIPAR